MQARLGPLIADSILAAPEAIAEAIRAYAGIGVDEITFWPTIAELEQVKLLADVIG